LANKVWRAEKVANDGVTSPTKNGNATYPMNPLKKPARNLQTGEGWEKVLFKEERTTN